MAKVGQGRPKSKRCSGCLTSAILPNMNVLAQVIGVLEPENRKVGQGVLTFYEGQGHVFHLPCKTIPSCMNGHDNVADTL